MNKLTHIAPQLPPAIDGVGDYCWNLWRHWPANDVHWEFLALHGVLKSRPHWPEVEITAFNDNADSLHRALEAAEAQTVVLHYVGYGFQPKGIPLWLPEALRRWRNSDAGRPRRLVTMFHEMYARSSPLRSPFWVAPFARGIIRELVWLSDAWITSCDRYFNQLTNEFGASVDSGRIIPIGSNIPVVAGRSANGELENRKLKFVSFGLARTRLWALERHWKLLRELNAAKLLDCVTLLGKHTEPQDTQAEESFVQRIGPGVNWRRRFDLTPREISHELVEHDLGLVANEPDILTKSGVFAALANHGVVPVISRGNNVALPKLLQHAVLANDDGKSIPGISQTVRSAGTLETLRERLFTLATRELSWPRIAQSWAEVLGSESTRHASQRAALASVDRNLEVPA